MECLSLDFTSPRVSMGSPNRLNILPRVALPTGTLMGAPVSSAFIPLISPSVEASAMHLTVSLPTCCATSRVRSIPFLVSLIFMALWMDGSLLEGNLISTTGPIICAICPIFNSFNLLFESTTIKVVVYLKQLFLFLRKRFRTGNYLEELLGDGLLPGPVIRACKLPDYLFRILRGGDHCDPSRRKL